MDDKTLTALIENQPARTSLEQAFYTDSDIYRRDIEQIFLKAWIYAGHLSEIPNVGDWFLLPDDPYADPPIANPNRDGTEAFWGYSDMSPVLLLGDHHAARPRDPEGTHEPGAEVRRGDGRGRGRRAFLPGRGLNRSQTSIRAQSAYPPLGFVSNAKCRTIGISCCC